MTMRECVACRHPLQGDICPNPSCARFCKPIANAPQVPPPDRPETMTANANDVEWAIEQASNSIHNSQYWRDEGTWDAYIQPMLDRVAATYAALEAVKAENAELREKYETANDSRIEMMKRGDYLRGKLDECEAQLADAQKDRARLKELADVVEAWYNGDDMSLAEAWVTYRNAARSGRKEADDAS